MTKQMVRAIATVLASMKAVMMTVDGRYRDDNRRVIIINIGNADESEVLTALSATFVDNRVTDYNSASELLLDKASDGQVLIVRDADGPSLQFKMRVIKGMKVNTLPPMILVVRTDPGELCKSKRSPWSMDFRLVPFRTFHWPTSSPVEPKLDIETVRILFTAAVTASKVFALTEKALEPLMTLARQGCFRSKEELVDIANSACLTAAQDGNRITVTAADITTALGAKRGSHETRKRGPSAATMRAAYPQG